MMISRYILVPVIALLWNASSLAAQNTADPAAIQALKDLQKLDQRLHEVGYRLTTENVNFCKEKTRRSGLLLHDIAQYGNQAAARAAHGFEAPISVNAVSGRTSRFINNGDGILSINSRAISDVSLDDPKLEKEDPQYRRLAAVGRLMDQMIDLRSAYHVTHVPIGLIRDGKEVNGSVYPSSACPSRFQIRPHKDKQASADGRLVSITSALAEYTQSEDELAAIAAHELAHNLLKHKDRLNAQKVNRGFFGQFGKSAGRIKATEIEADRLSIWLMKNAGYNPQAAIRFWTRYGKEHGRGVFSASTHYRWKKRVKLFEEELAKIATMKPVRGKYAPPLLAAVQ